MTRNNKPGGVTDGSPADNPDLAFHSMEPGIQGIGAPRYMVNTATLRLFVQDVLYSYKAKGPAIIIALSYNHVPGMVGMFGRNWRFSYESELQQTGKKIVLRKESGHTVEFQIDPAATVPHPGNPADAIPPKGIFDRLLNYGTYWAYCMNNSRILQIYDMVQKGPARLSRISDYDGNTVTLSYNPDMTLQAITDAGGRSILFSYNSQRLCTSVILPDGRTASCSYDTNQNLIRVTDFGSVPAEYEYDPDHALVRIRTGQESLTQSFSYHCDLLGKHIDSVSGPGGGTSRYEVLSPEPRHIRITDPEGGTLQYFSSQGKTTRVIDPLGNSVEFGTGGGKRTSYRDKNGNSTLLEYDARGNLTRDTHADGGVYQYFYDVFDNVVAEIDPLGRKTVYEYDPRQHLIRMILPSGKMLSFEYDTSGQLVREVYPVGNIHTSHYDRFGNVDEIIDPNGHRIRFSYDDSGLRLASVTDARGNIHQIEYDGNDRITRITNPDGSQVTYTYTVLGKTGYTDQNGSTSRIKRNAGGKITEQVDPSESSLKFTYDRNSRLVTRTDVMDRQMRFSYDAASRLSQITNRLGSTIGFLYDNEGNILQIMDENGNPIRFSYGKNYLIETATDALGHSVKITRDIMGRSILVSNTRGNIVAVSYNDDDQIVEKKYAGKTVAAFGYNLSGNLISAQDELGKTSYSYSSGNFLKTIQYRTGSIVSFSYDGNGNLLSVTYPHGITVSYGYDSADRVTSVRWLDHLIELVYNKTGNIISEQRSNGTQSTYTYDLNNRLAGLVHRSRDTVIADLISERNRMGIIIRETGTCPLSSPPAPDVLPPVPATAFYNPVNQLVSSSQDQFTYDADGNLTGVEGTRSWAAEYDAENRLVDIILNGKHTRYQYGCSGPRARKIRDGKVTDFHYSMDGTLLFETDGDGSLARYYIYADGYLLAMGDAGNQPFFYHADKTGNILAVTDLSGEIIASYAYDPFGTVTGRQENGITNPFTFCGAFGVMDEGDGLFFMMHRYYDAVTGRFIQKDPVGISGGLNLYTYVNNNPVMTIDPEGLGLKSRFDSFMVSTFRQVRANQYVKRGWNLFDSWAGNYIRGRVAPFEKKTVLAPAVKVIPNFRTGGPAVIPPSQIPNCTKIQRGTRALIKKGATDVTQTALELIPVVPGLAPLGGVPRVVGALQVLHAATSNKDPRPVTQAVVDSFVEKNNSLVKSVVTGNDPLDGFDAKEAVINAITGGE